MPVLQDLQDLAPVINPIVGSVANAVGTGQAVGDITDQANQTANMVQNTGNQNAATQADVLAQQKQLLNPWLTAGAGAVNTLSTDPSLTAPFSYTQADLEKDPAYQFDLQQANKNAYAQAAARGLSLSGGAIRNVADYTTGLADKTFGADYARSENTFRANQASRLGLLQNLSNSGQQAANTESAATGAYGAASTQNKQFTANELATIQSQIADAKAAGDVSKANALSSLISGAMTAAPIVGKVLGIGSNAAQLATNPAVRQAIEVGAPAAATAIGAGSMAGAGTIAEGIGTPSIIGATGTAAAEAAPAAAGTAGGGFGAAAIGFLTNPITIGVGAAILAVTAILKSQAHWEANTLVKDVQNPFGENLGKIVNGFDQALASGQLDRATAQQMRDQTAAVINDFNNKVYEFAQGGSDEKEAALNAMRTMAENFGARSDYPNLPSYDKILGKMDQEIAALPA